MADDSSVFQRYGAALTERFTHCFSLLALIVALSFAVQIDAATITAGTATTACEAEVNVGMSASDVPAFISLSFAILYDPTRLSYVRAVPSGALEGWTFTPTESAGRIAILLRPPTRLAVTNTFATIAFEVVDRSSSAPISLVVSDITIQLAVGTSIGGTGVAGAIHPRCGAIGSGGFIFRHLAGSTAGPGAADGQGSQARFGAAYGIVAKGDGTLYVADKGNYTIRHVSPDGFVSTIAGRVGRLGTSDGRGTDARFLAPRDIANARDGVFVLDGESFQTPARIRHVSAVGDVRTIARAGGSCAEGGEPADTFALCDRVEAIASDGADNIYIHEETRIRRIGSDGTITPVAGVPGLLELGFRDGKGRDARFDGRAGSMAVGPDGNLYIYEPINRAIRVVTPDGETTTLMSGPPLPGNAQDSTIAVGDDGAVYIHQTSEVFRIDSTGIRIVAYVYGSTGRRFALDSRGDIVLSLAQGTEIWRLLFSEGRVERVAGHAAEGGIVDGRGDQARFDSIYALAYNGHDGLLYVADRQYFPVQACTIRVVTMRGEVRTLRTTEPVCASHLLPAPDGNLIALEVTDGPTTAKRVTRDGRVTPFAVLPDNCRAFNVATDARGNIYLPCVARSSSGAPLGYIAKLRPDGSVTVAAEGVSGEALTILENGDLVLASHFRLVRITAGGSVLPFAGSGLFPLQADGTLSSASFGFMVALAPRRDGSVYVMDIGVGNWVLLRHATSSGDVTTVAGGGIGSENGDARTARFTWPVAIAILPGGEIVLAESNALRIGTAAGAHGRRRSVRH